MIPILTVTRLHWRLQIEVLVVRCRSMARPITAAFPSHWPRPSPSQRHIMGESGAATAHALAHAERWWLDQLGREGAETPYSSVLQYGSLPLAKDAEAMASLLVDPGLAAFLAERIAAGRCGQHEISSGNGSLPCICLRCQWNEQATEVLGRRWAAFGVTLHEKAAAAADRADSLSRQAIERREVRAPARTPSPSPSLSPLARCWEAVWRVL